VTTADGEAPANAVQRAAWNGARGEHWITFAETYDAQLAPYVVPLLDAAGIEPKSSVLDIGCGCGATTLAAARRAPDGSAVGVDLSEPMVDMARARADGQGVSNARFVVADVQTDRLDDGVDTAISRFGVMFFEDPVAAFSNVARSLVPGGGLAFTSWRAIEHNDWLRVPRDALRTVVPVVDEPPPGAPGPVAFGDPGRVRTILDESGYEAVELEELAGPVLIGGGLSARECVQFLRGTSMIEAALSGVDADTERRALDSVGDALAEHETADGVLLGASAWVVRATRR
jgi:SAM-dependent methyltransferase